jgi:hypothetical protein
METDRVTGDSEPIGGMLDVTNARCLLSSRVPWGSGRVVDGALVEGGLRPTAVPQKGGEGCGDS